MAEMCEAIKTNYIVVSATETVCNYFVDYDHTNANNNNAGTLESAPWQTIEHAIDNKGTASSVKKGDTICVKERNAGQAYDGDNEINISGANGQYITLQAYPGHAPRIEYQRKATSCLSAGRNIEYIIIDGFECTKGSFSGKEDYDLAGFGFYGNNTSNIIIRNNYIHDVGITQKNAPNPAIIFGGRATHNQILVENNVFENIGGEGVYVGSASSGNQNSLTTDVIIQNNTFTNIAQEAVDIKPNVLGAQVLNNTMSYVGQSWAGVRLDGQGVEFAYNTMRYSGCSGYMYGASYCDGGSYAIAFADGHYDNHYIHHNYFFDTAKVGGWADSHIKLVSEKVTNPFRIEHNTFVGAGKYGLFLNEETGAHRIENNLFVTSADMHIKKHIAKNVIVDNNAFDSSNFDVTDDNAIIDTVAKLKVNLSDGFLSAGSPLIGAASDGTNIGAWQGGGAGPDVTPPVITVLGNNLVEVEVGSSYTDAGATALDETDGDLTSNIVTINPVDTNTVGTYTVTYNISDAAGNAASEKTRTVIVSEENDGISTLKITKLGEGRGRIMAKIKDKKYTINCKSTCQESSFEYSNGSKITVSAKPSTGFAFTSWGNDCWGNKRNMTITVTSDMTCTVNFEPLPSSKELIVGIVGGGKVTTQYIDCGKKCKAYYPAGKKVRLKAIPDTGYSFVNWSGNCSGTRPSILVTMDATQNCVASFFNDLEKAVQQIMTKVNEIFPDLGNYQQLQEAFQLTLPIMMILDQQYPNWPTSSFEKGYISGDYTESVNIMPNFYIEIRFKDNANPIRIYYEGKEEGDFISLSRRDIALW